MQVSNSHVYKHSAAVYPFISHTQQMYATKQAVSNSHKLFG